MKLYQSFIGASQRSRVATVCTPYDASWNTRNDSREYELFRDIHSGRNSDEPWGLLSWKFEHKTSIPVAAFKAFCENQIKAGYDCAFINPMIAMEAIYKNVWEQGEHCGHKGLVKIAKHLHRHDGLNITQFMGAESYSFCNYFVGTPVFWDAYFTFVEHALSVLDEQVQAGTDIGKIFAGSGRYTRDPDASMRIFVIERMFSAFVKSSKEIRCAPFLHSKTVYIKKFGEQLGTLLYQLSMAKNRALQTNDAGLLDLWKDTRFSFIKGHYVHTIWNMDDPDDMYLGKQYQALIERMADQDPNES